MAFPSDEEEDYLKLDVEQLEETTKKRHSTYSERRKREIEASKERGKMMSLKEREEQSRQQGMNTAISVENRGFQLLKKMGFQEGRGLGKTFEGIEQPIPLKMHPKLAGVGLEGARKEKLGVENAKRTLQESNTQAHFVERKRQKFDEKRIQHDLIRARRACEDLDAQAGVGQHAFWPEPLKTVPEANKIDAEESYSRYVVDVDDEGDEASQAADPFLSLPIQDQLCVVVGYLREKYAYCIWCGHRFASSEELSEECPGDTAQAHDA